ncbi:unnamed protein product [Rhodiola kirilowii]
MREPAGSWGFEEKQKNFEAGNCDPVNRLGDRQHSSRSTGESLRAPIFLTSAVDRLAYQSIDWDFP